VVVGIVGANYLLLERPLDQALAEDERNQPGILSARYGTYVNPNVLVLSLSDQCGDTSPAGMLRALFQSAEALGEAEFARVELHSRGEHRFTLDGDAYQSIGEEFGVQNVMYQVRKFPEKLSLPSGEPAYGSVSGGLFGVLRVEMENVNDFAVSWCQPADRVESAEGMGEEAF
jgi:hypothetical protein